jgi:hypothetical protein
LICKHSKPHQLSSKHVWCKHFKCTQFIFDGSCRSFKLKLWLWLKLKLKGAISYAR